jgi:hypothetical protein
MLAVRRRTLVFFVVCGLKLLAEFAWKRARNQGFGQGEGPGTEGITGIR